MRFFLVGGAVRDILLGKSPADEDYLVLNASRESLRARFPKAAEVGTLATAFMLPGAELSLPRSAHNAPLPAKELSSQRLESIVDADLCGRDLTINALALDENGELHAHPTALEDLYAGVLRPCSPTALANDPLRTFRAARMWAQLPDFTPHPELIAAMKSVAQSGALAQIAAERVGKEALKALAAPKPSNFLRLLADTGCLEPWFAELADADGVPAGPWPYHKGSLLRHVYRVLDNMAALRPADELAGWMGLTHDLGKTCTQPEDWPKHHGHDKLGENKAMALAQRLLVPRAHTRAGVLAARWHMVAACYTTLRPGTRVDLLDTLLKAGALERMFALVEADAPEEGPPATGLSMLEQARRDADCIRSVRLRPEERGQGAWSGQRLRELRCLALARA
ncbi:MAG: tRNA nucleotidyltransferase [Okeania sp. SIO3B3]|nr:tRNA nucleotidyltransferase [Okeania sp. SIO3B3]